MDVSFQCFEYSVMSNLLGINMLSVFVEYVYWLMNEKMDLI